MQSLSETADLGVHIQPMSYAQQRLWILDQLIVEARHAYNVPILYDIGGPLDVAILQHAFNSVVERHASLRTTFARTGEAIQQFIHPSFAPEIPLIDFSSLAGSEVDEKVRQRLALSSSAPFDLNKGPLIRIELLRISAHQHMLLIVMHHIISDGWSINNLDRELWTLYDAYSNGEPSPLKELPLQYYEYAVAQRERLQGGAMASQLDYWRGQLANAPGNLELPTDYPYPARQSFSGGQHRLIISKPLVDALKSIGFGQRCTLFIVLMAAYKAFLHRYTQQTDLIVGTPIANRWEVEVEPLIGFFVNMLALRSSSADDPPFTRFLKQVRKVCIEGQSNGEIPFEMLVADIQADRDLSRPPLFQTAFALQNMPRKAVDVPGLRISYRNIHTGTAKYDLLLYLSEKDGELVGYFEYNRDLFTETTVRRLEKSFKTLLRGIVAEPETPLSRLPLLTFDEQSQLLEQGEGLNADYPADYAVHQLFEEQAAQSPEDSALRLEADELSYRELNQRANQLARCLRAEGVEPGDRVGLCLDRSSEAVIGTLAILKAGGVYVPLDPGYPNDRLSFMLGDSGATLMLANSRLVDNLPVFDGAVICLDADWSKIAAHSSENLDLSTDAMDAAYVMYTSGSTGQPKGVCVSHRNIVRLVRNNDYADLSARQVFLQLAPLTFDASTFEIWAALLNGALLTIFPEQKPDLGRLGTVIEQNRVTTLFLSSGLFHQMVDHNPDKLRRVQQLLTGGDVVSIQHVQRALDVLPNTRLINAYGPTENAAFTTCYPVSANTTLGASVPIGRPVANTQVYILDTHLQPVPIGVTGELYTGGDGVALGYLNQPELTAERFVPDPFSVDADRRLYKTGDLARWLPDGNIDFVGRVDDQVKVRGFRIELGEIETCLARHPSVQSCVVLARADRSGDKRLVAYIVPADETNREVWRVYLESKLAPYMIPSVFVTLEHLPLTTNGKVDRQLLPEPEFALTADNNDHEMPDGPVENMLAEIWGEVLGVDRIGLHDNFFQLGGHSLLATKVLARLSQEHGVEIPFISLFEAPTIARLTEVIEAILLGDEDECAGDY